MRKEGQENLFRVCSRGSYSYALILSSPLLDEASLVNDQGATFEAEVIFDIIVENVPNTVRVPLRHAQQTLHPIRHFLAGLFRQLPAVLAFRRPQQPLQVIPTALDIDRLCPFSASN